MPPPTDGHDATLRAIAQVYPQQTPDLSVELDDLTNVLDEWRAAKAERNAADVREKAAKAAICAALADGEEGTVNGERVVSWRQQTRESYVVKEASFRVLRETKPKKSKERAA
jgi:predicted transcriptional regulator